MNNLINMSDHEKVIFITGIDETKNTEFLPGGIKSIAKDYPFAIFFTTDDRTSETFNYPIMNIWKGGLVNGEIQGIRLTRFVGIDEENNTLQINDHTIKLLFDYETGKIGLYDANKLESLQLIGISYIGITGINNEYNYTGDPILISAKDNMFNLIFRFESVKNGDASKISNNLKIGDNNDKDFILVSKTKIISSYSETSNEDTAINNEYRYQIVTDTYNNDGDYKEYNFISEYSTDKADLVNLSLILNPISYDMSYKNTLLGSIITQIETGTIAKIDVNFKPSNVTSYDKRKLYMTITSDNSEYATICDELGNPVNEFPIYNGYSSFYIKTADKVINNNVSTNLHIDIWYTFDNSTQKYTYLSSTKTIILSAEYVDTFWYAGFNDPTLDSFDINKLMIFNSENVGKEFLYDWINEDQNDNIIGISELSEEHTEDSKFYIAIPNTYKDIIKPRWDGFYIENGVEIYTDCTSWFDIDRKRINNIEFTIYKSKFTGNFYGKIK